MAVASVAMHVPAEAKACGGTFCDAFTPDMPVDQTAEGILFVSDGDFVEAHVQIQYDGGDAEQFAWMVPVPAIPEIEVGSWRLIQAALQGTRPIHSTTTEYVCDDSGAWGEDGGGFIRNPDGGGASNEPDPGPTVVAQDVVGAFEYAVLEGGSSDTVNDWLVANDYATDVDAPEILDAYIAEGSVFVAFRLRHGANIEDIHPVVIRYPGTEPCIPLRLTRIAAKEDMDITAVFLGDSRVVPTNYRHVQLNRVRLDWLFPDESYPQLVSMAVDAPGADGRAFVTEYAGSSAVIDDTALSTAGLSSGAFADLPVLSVIDELQAQGLASCSEQGCTYRHELVPSLLSEFVPVPAGLSPEQFYGCLSCYAQLVDLDAWDGPGFAAAFDERIVAPMQHGEQLLAMWPYATRLYTRMSPHEMISDPMFAELPGLEDVPNRHGAERSFDCCGTTVRLPGGREVSVYGANTWPVFDDAMPWAERIEEYTAAGGAPVVLVDDSALIDTLLAAWNAEDPCVEDPTGTTGGGADTTAGDPGREDGSATSGDSSGTDGGPSQDVDGGSISGCGCTSGGPAGPTSWMLMLLGLGALTRRRS